MSSTKFRLEETLRHATAIGTSPAVSMAVSRGDEDATYFHFGRTMPKEGSQVSSKTIYDLASLTKPLTTTLWALTLVDAGTLDMEKPIRHYLPIHDQYIGGKPVWTLMNHTSGWRPYRRYFKGLGRPAMTLEEQALSKRTIRKMISRDQAEKTDSKIEIYSDIGYLCLEWICESLDQSLEERWRGLPFHGGDAIHFTNLDNQGNKLYAATENCPWRKVMLQGVVHDDNAWVMGGHCGHAGAFGDLNSVHGLAVDWMRASNKRKHQLGIDTELILFALDRSRITARGSRILGWDTPSPSRSTAGQYFGRRSFGHLGFTGTSIWIDPDSEVVITLLTNRVCPSRDNDKIKLLRPLVHNLAYEWVIEKTDQKVQS